MNWIKRTSDVPDTVYTCEMCDNLERFRFYDASEPFAMDHNVGVSFNPVPIARRCAAHAGYALLPLVSGSATFVVVRVKAKP